MIRRREFENNRQNSEYYRTSMLTFIIHLPLVFKMVVIAS